MYYYDNLNFPTTDAVTVVLSKGPLPFCGAPFFCTLVIPATRGPGAASRRVDVVLLLPDASELVAREVNLLLIPFSSSVVLVGPAASSSRHKRLRTPNTLTATATLLVNACKYYTGVSSHLWKSS